MANRRNTHWGIWGVIGAIFLAGLACQTLLDPPGNDPQPQSYTPIDPYWLSFSELSSEQGL